MEKLDRFKVVEKYKSSNLTRLEFCDLHSIKFFTLKKWISEYNSLNISDVNENKPKAKRSSFLKIELPNHYINKGESITLELPNGIKIYAGSLSLNQDLVNFAKELAQ